MADTPKPNDPQIKSASEPAQPATTAPAGTDPKLTVELPQIRKGGAGDLSIPGLVRK